MNKYTYQIIKTITGEVILRSDGACIPADLSNADYQEYLNPTAQSKEITTPQGGSNE